MKKIIFTILICNVLIPLYTLARNNNLSYPYIASAERQRFITENYKKIKINQTEQDVKQLLGTPDEVLPLYESKIKNPKKIGYTFWYILQRLKERGSQNEKSERIIRFSFNLDGKIISIDQWGL